MERKSLVTGDVIEALYASNCFEEEFTNEAAYHAELAFEQLSIREFDVDSLLNAHKILMQTRSTVDQNEIGAFRTEPCRVGLALMPPTELVPEYTEKAVELADHRGAEATGDFLAKLHPFADGNGRMARMVMYMMQKQAGEELVPFEGRHALSVAREYQAWLSNNYPKMKPGDDLYEADNQNQFWPWRTILDGELRG